jgi:hypothetical protein
VQEKRSSLQGYGEKRASKVFHKSYSVIKMQKCVAIGMMLGEGGSPQKPGMLVVFGILSKLVSDPTAPFALSVMTCNLNIFLCPGSSK